MRVRQILVTYFNRRLDDIYYTKALDNDWLEYRWKLFNTFTVASVCAQTYTDFDWVILCHERSPKWLRDRAKALELPCRVRFSFDVIDPAKGEIDAALSDLNDSSFDVVLTTRVDSDDALHRCAMARIRESFEANLHRYEIFNFEVGYQYDCLSQRLAIVKLASPPFNTKINKSPAFNPLDVGGKHFQLSEKYQYRDISQGDPMFLQVIHSDNILNRMGSTSYFLSRSLSRHILQEAFDIDDPIRQMPLRSYWSDIRGLTRQVRRDIVTIAKDSLGNKLRGRSRPYPRNASS